MTSNHPSTCGSRPIDRPGDEFGAWTSLQRDIVPNLRALPPLQPPLPDPASSAAVAAAAVAGPSRPPLGASGDLVGTWMGWAHNAAT